MNVSAALRAALRARHPPPDWAMAFEVQAERDEGGLRFADAIAFDTRKGAGMAVHGFELKVSRGDWLNELRDPAKAQAARGVCDYWWIVAGDSGIVRDAEVPLGAGLLEANVRGGLDAVYPARRESFRPLDRALMAAFLRRLDPMEPRAYWEGRERQAERKGYAKGRSEAGRVARSKARRVVDDGGPLSLP